MDIRFELVTALVMKSLIFWDISPCSLLKFNPRFGVISPPSAVSKKKPA
jgi:hypothetical protein